MLKTYTIIARFLGLLFFGIAFIIPTYAADSTSAREESSAAIEITRIKPTEGDLQKVAQKRKQGGVGENEDQVHVVQLRVKMSKPGGEVDVLYVGDTKIEEYGAYDGGIFFKVYARKDLETLRGKPLRFIRGDQAIDLGVKFPSEIGEKKGVLPELHEVLERK